MRKHFYALEHCVAYISFVTFGWSLSGMYCSNAQYDFMYYNVGYTPIVFCTCFSNIVNDHAKLKFVFVFFSSSNKVM